MAYRDEDVDARLGRIEERVGKIEANERTAAWTEALRAWRVPEAIGIALLLAAVFGMAVYARNCTHAEDLDAHAREDRLAATPPPESSRAPRFAAWLVARRDIDKALKMLNEANK